MCNDDIVDGDGRCVTLLWMGDGEVWNLGLHGDWMGSWGLARVCLRGPDGARSAMPGLYLEDGMV
jgi:hypothetical protein